VEVFEVDFRYVGPKHLKEVKKPLPGSGIDQWGIYTDEGSTDILIENNLSYRCNSSPFHQHYGKDNIIQNNIFAFGEESAIQRTKIEPHCSFIFKNNIVYLEQGTILGGNFQKPAAFFEKNLYYSPKRRCLDFGGRTFTEWKKLGQDKGSIIADPKFVNPKKWDFRLRKSSPAFKIGFKEIDFSKVGPRSV